MLDSSRVLCLFLALPLLADSSTLAGAPVTWISSTAEKPWQTMAAPALAPVSPDKPAHVRVAPARGYQVIDGFGGCFNELGWEALGRASAGDRERVIRALFADDGCAFNLARLPIGASDFALDAYSLNDSPDDFELKDFSIERDRKRLIPFVKAAMQVRPALRCWGSPWSPPAWMKTNNHYSKGSIRWEPNVLSAYAKHLAMWVEAYRAAGINVFAVLPQNEPNILNDYPTCEWTGRQLREFIADYLGPTLRDRKLDAELWLGTLNDGNVNDRAVAVLEDPKASAFVTGVAFQYDAKASIGPVGQLYPDKKLMQSETECNNGDNTWADAQRLFALMKHYLDNHANSYFAWNMVLDETGMSSWKWRQNALITIDRGSGKVRFNGEYYVMRHFSQFVKPGARRVLTTGVWGDKIAFVNPDASIVMVIGNSADKPLAAILTVAGGNPGAPDTLDVILPAKSINTFVIAPPK
jgi:glucosylceramidase